MNLRKISRATIFGGLTALLLLIGAGVVFNPIGEFRLRRTEAHLAKELANLAKGSEIGAIQAFCDRERLIATEPMRDPTTYNPPLPPGTKYQIYARDEYEAAFFGVTARVVVNFWLDENKRLVGTEVTRTGSAF